MIKLKTKNDIFAVALTVVLIVLAIFFYHYSIYNYKWPAIVIISIVSLWHLPLMGRQKKFQGIKGSLGWLGYMGLVHLIYLPIWVICIIFISKSST